MFQTFSIRVRFQKLRSISTSTKCYHQINCSWHVLSCPALIPSLLRTSVGIKNKPNDYLAKPWIVNCTIQCFHLKTIKRDAAQYHVFQGEFYDFFWEIRELQKWRILERRWNTLPLVKIPRLKTLHVAPNSGSLSHGLLLLQGDFLESIYGNQYQCLLLVLFGTVRVLWNLSILLLIANKRGEFQWFTKCNATQSFSTMAIWRRLVPFLVGASWSDSFFFNPHELTKIVLESFTNVYVPKLNHLV